MDTTPWDDVEFVRKDATNDLVARAGEPASTRADLLTAVLHELGHLLDHDHDDSGLMQDSLPLGTRRLGSLPPTLEGAIDAVFAEYDAVPI